MWLYFQKTPGSIVFTLHVSDNLRIVSVRSEDSFTMTADLCNEEGEFACTSRDIVSSECNYESGEFI